MHTVVIVDDEYLVCELIKELVKWDEIGLELVGQAANGEEALSMIQNLKPDIVITDIRIPGVDGLEVVRRTRESGANVKFIMISGHQQFDYAYNAIKYGVEDYLLKPIQEEEINNALLHICNQLDDNQKQRSLNDLLLNELEIRTYQLRRKFIEDIIDGNLPRDIDIISANEKYCMAFQPGFFEIIIFKFDQLCFRDKKSTEKLNIVINKIENEIYKYLKETCTEVQTYYNESKLYCVVNYLKENAANHKPLLRNLFEETCLINDLYKQFIFTMGIGTPVKDLERIRQSYKTAFEAIHARIIQGAGRIISHDDLKSYKSADLLENGGYMNDLSIIVETCDLQKLIGWAEDIFKKIRGNNISPAMVFRFLEEVVQHVCSVAAGLGIRQEDRDAFRDGFYEKMYNLTTMDELEKTVKSELTAFLEVCSENIKMQHNKPVREAKKYIHEHFSENITLEDIAQVVHLNPVYLSALFKNETGLTITDYIIKARIDKAKEYLTKTNFTIYQIAEQIGYKDTQHFGKLFKKTVGITPKVYRKLHV